MSGTDYNLSDSYSLDTHVRNFVLAHPFQDNSSDVAIAAVDEVRAMDKAKLQELLQAGEYSATAFEEILNQVYG